ncbi:MAG: hypothetical protein KA479_09280 [Saprospiraceae bacterium]|nr:hypothetical protein [Saprospiraceae bacterium]
MKKLLFLPLTFLLTVLHVLTLTSQTNSGQIQPTIMVIPFASKGEGTRKTMESNHYVRTAMTKVKEGFDSRGVNTIDLRSKLNELGISEVMQEEQQTDMKDEVLAMSGADIYVEVECKTHRSESGNSASVILTAYDAYSSESLANKVANSPMVYTDNYDKLIEKAVESEMNNFLNTIQDKFNDVVANGRSVKMTVGIKEGESFNMDAEFNDEMLSILLENWMEKNAFNGYFHIQGTTSNKIIFDIIKIPLKDERGNNYRVSKFVSQFTQFVRSLGLDLDRDVIGNNITITLKSAS